MTIYELTHFKKMVRGAPFVLTQMCNRHALRANVNKASKQAKRGESLLVQGKRHVRKKALLAHGTLSHFYGLKS